MEISLSRVHDVLYEGGYVSNEGIDNAVWVSLLCERPLIVEGAPGVGKTAIAKALSRGLGLELVRLQMYEGLTDDRVLYDYDYARQLLTLEAVKPQVEREFGQMSAADAVRGVAASLDFYGDEFLIRRPVLRSITSGGRVVLLIDEMDKAPEEIEYMLYEFLEDYSITIPQSGEVRCDESRRPVVVITSNGYRELSGALRRRCNYLYVERKTREEMAEILLRRATDDEHVARGVARCMEALASAGCRRAPSVSEAIDYASFLGSGHATREEALAALSLLAKDRRDAEAIRCVVTQNGEEIWSR